MEKKKTGIMYRFLNHSATNIMLSLLIVVSIVFLLVFRIGDYNVRTQKIFEWIDEIFLIIFSIEFLVKIVFLRKEYFFKNLGWIDFLAAIPVLIPVIKYLILQSNSNAFLDNEAVNIAIMFRGLKFVRFLRVLRTARLFKIFNTFSREGIDQPKFPITMPIIFSIILLILGYSFATYTENQLTDAREQEMKKFVDIINDENIKTVLKTKPYILILNYGLNFERTVSDVEIIENYRSYECKSIKKEGIYIYYSEKDLLRVSKNIETFAIIIIMIFIILVFIQFNLDVKQIYTNIESRKH